MDFLIGYLEYLRDGIKTGRFDPCSLVYGPEHRVHVDVVNSHIEILNQVITALKKPEVSTVDILTDALVKAKERYDKVIAMNGNDAAVRRAMHNITGIAHQLNEAKKLEMKEQNLKNA